MYVPTRRELMFALLVVVLISISWRIHNLTETIRVVCRNETVTDD